MDTDTCLICANSFTKKTRVKITCPYCSFESCKECCQTYLLNESIPKCMNTECNREWTRHFISASFSGNFIKNEYKKHREEILFNNERALLPATQPIVERELQKRKWQEDMKKIRDEITELNNEYMRLFGLVNRIQHNPRETERAVFVRACPDSECRGYLSTQWKCGICEKWTCPECHEIKGLTRDVEHTCNPENVETAKLISQDTKSCPSCRTRIFKIDGCDQMWCTQCHTAFSWRTGRIETTVHNPHYYEWMRRGGNALPPNENANRCQRVQLINHEFTSDVLRDLRTRILTDKTITLEMQVAIKKKMDHFSNICRAITHIRHVDIPRYNYNHILNNQELRVKYMMNEMDEAKFKCILQQNDKRHQKNREIHNILQMFHDASSDILFRFKGDVEQMNIPLNFETLIELTPLIEYTNECFAEISRTYHSVTLYINDNFKLASIS